MPLDCHTDHPNIQVGPETAYLTGRATNGPRSTDEGAYEDGSGGKFVILRLESGPRTFIDLRFVAVSPNPTPDGGFPVSNFIISGIIFADAESEPLAAFAAPWGDHDEIFRSVGSKRDRCP